jgi:hypothetical protein
MDNPTLINIYRISDYSNPEKIKPDYATKEDCLRNFVHEFTNKNLIVICDNIVEETFKMVCKYVPEHNIIITSNGNTGSFLFSWKLAKGIVDRDEVPADTVFYFIEDDYIHRRGSRKALLEAFSLLNASYVSLYDHPDKYQNFKDGRFTWDHGKQDEDINGVRVPKHIYFTVGEAKERACNLYVTKSCHWRTVGSTTMTWATTVKHINEDFQDMVNLHTDKHLPMGGDTFRMLASKGKQLISPLPSYSAHAEEKWLPYFINWEKQAKQ